LDKDGAKVNLKEKVITDELVQPKAVS